MKTTKSLFGILTITAVLCIGTTAQAQRTATAVAEISDGQVQKINLTDAGDGYNNKPLIKIVGGGGTGAKAVVLNFDSYYPIKGIDVESGGSGYTSTPEVKIESPEQAQARIQAESEKKLEFQAKAEAQAKLEVQSGTEQIKKLKKMPLQVTAIVAGGFVVVWAFLFFRVISKQGQAIAQINLTPIFKQYVKPLFVSGLVTCVGLICANMVIQKVQKAKALYYSTDTVTGSFVITGGNGYLAARWQADRQCIEQLGEKYDSWDVVKFTDSRNTERVGVRNLQADMDSATRTAIAIGATKRQHTDMLRDAIMQSANASSQEYVVSEVTVTHLTKKTARKVFSPSYDKLNEEINMRQSGGSK